MKGRRWFVWFVLVLGIVGCGRNATDGEELGSIPLTLRAAVEQSQVKAEEPVVLTVELTMPVGTQVAQSRPQAEGLEVSVLDTEGPTHVQGGERTVVRYRLTGDAGSYVIFPGDVRVGGQDADVAATASPIFVDIGVKGPSGGQMEGFLAAPDGTQGVSLWWWVAAVVVLLGVLLAWWWSRRGSDSVPEREAEEDRALRMWRSVRESGMADHPMAVELSMILRRYLEGVFFWSATAETTREVLAYLRGHSLLDAEGYARAERVLDATDRLKFAREGGGEAFFVALDEDFFALVQQISVQTQNQDVA